MKKDDNATAAAERIERLSRSGAAGSHRIMLKHDHVNGNNRRPRGSAVLSGDGTEEIVEGDIEDDTTERSDPVILIAP